MYMNVDLRVRLDISVDLLVRARGRAPIRRPIWNAECTRFAEAQMPEKETLRRARRSKRRGKAASTQAGEFVREEMHHIRGGKHGAKSSKQAIAIGLSKARRAGVKLPRPPAGAKRSTKRSAAAAARAGRRGRKQPSARRSRATSGALKRAGRSAASRKALSRQARSAARRRSASSRSQSARRAARTRQRRRHTSRRRRATA